MSAFFLCDNTKAEYIKTAEAAFLKRGFKSGKRFSLKNAELLLYKKQNIETENFFADEHGAIYAVGTPVYKGLSYKQSLKSLLCDLSRGEFMPEELIGQYVILYATGEKTTLITDKTGSYKLFAECENGFVTSSFLAAAACIERLTLNKTALAEQLLCGFISRPDTLVNEVKALPVKPQPDEIPFCEIYPHSPSADYFSRSKAEGVKRQYEKIKEYMHKTRALCREYGAECGLSGGCDSRLICAAVNTECVKMNSAHTHATGNIHNKEHGPVKRVAEMFGVPLNVVATEYLPDCESSVIDKTLKENFNYFDGRNAENIGAFSLTHTREYKTAVAGGNGVTFTGICGEIYRNFYFTSLPVFGAASWLETRIFLNGVKEMLPEHIYLEARQNIKEKFFKAIGKNSGKLCNPEDAKRYFDTYRIPNALANVISANNQESFYLAPFAENDLIASARPDNKWQDHCGGYEGEIISLFSPQAAKLKTSKGYALSHISFKTKLRWKARELSPAFLWKLRNRAEKPSRKSAAAYKALCEKSEYFKAALAFFCEMFPEIDIKPVENGEAALNNFVFTVSCVYEIFSASEGRSERI